jgi:hypothetical protein
MKAKIIKSVHAHLFKDENDLVGKTHNLQGMVGETTPRKDYNTGVRREQWFTPAGYKTSVLVHPSHMVTEDEPTKLMNEDGEAASNVSGGTGLSSASVQTNAPNTTNLEGYSLPFKKRKNHIGLKVKGDVFRRLTNEDFGPRSEPSPATSIEGGNGQAKTLDDETESTKESINSLISKGERILLECEGSSDVLLVNEMFEIKNHPHIDSFMKDYHANTEAHPFDRRIRLHSNDVGTELSRFGDRVHMSSIINFNDKGKGHASKTLRDVTSLADKHGVKLHLSVKPFKAGSMGKDLNTKGLASWYGRHGFKGSNSDMTRQPNVSEALYDGKFETSRRAATHKTGVENRGAIALSTPKSTTKKRQLTKYSTSNVINNR